MKEKTSLEKSHSVFSNFKLTLLCLLAAVAVGALFAGLGLVRVLPAPVGVLLLSGGGVLTLLCFALLQRFRR